MSFIGLVFDSGWAWYGNLTEKEESYISEIVANHETDGFGEEFCGYHINLGKIKKFAEENFNADCPIYVETETVNVTNPWMDESGRFELSDVGAVQQWGLETVVRFILLVSHHIMK